MLKKFFSRQARRPSGLLGRLLAPRIFERGNRASNALMLELVGASGDDKILEIGFGNGSALKQMASALKGGNVEGVDYSAAMMQVAQRKNRVHIAKGCARLVQGDFDSTSYPAGRFDTVCSANTIYFWPNLEATAAKIHDVLKPGGKLVLAFVDKSKMKDMPLDMEIFQPISHQEVGILLEGVGFSNIQAHAVSGRDLGEYCVEAYKGLSE